MNDRLKESIEMLYVARWNVPRAALHCGVSTEEMMRVFKDHIDGGESPPPR